MRNSVDQISPSYADVIPKNIHPFPVSKDNKPFTSFRNYNRQPYNFPNKKLGFAVDKIPNKSHLKPPEKYTPSPVLAPKNDNLVPFLQDLLRLAQNR